MAGRCLGPTFAALATHGLDLHTAVTVTCVLPQSFSHPLEHTHRMQRHRLAITLHRLRGTISAERGRLDDRVTPGVHSADPSESLDLALDLFVPGRPLVKELGRAELADACARAYRRWWLRDTGGGVHRRDAGLDRAVGHRV